MVHAESVGRDMTRKEGKLTYNNPLDNKERRIMLSEMGTLKAARKERLLQGKEVQPNDTFAQRRAADIIVRDELTEGQWEGLHPEGRYAAIGAGVQRISKEYRAELSRIKWEAIEQAR